MLMSLCVIPQQPTCSFSLTGHGEVRCFRTSYACLSVLAWISWSLLPGNGDYVECSVGRLAYAAGHTKANVWRSTELSLSSMRTRFGSQTSFFKCGLLHT